MTTIYHRGNYRQQRAMAYPPIGEQLDAIWKALGEIKAAGVNLGPAADEMLSRVNAIKALMVKR